MPDLDTQRSAKHHALTTHLREVVAGLPVGSPLPSERRLAEDWGVARMTVRQAIATLVRDGLVRTVHGRGHLRAPETLRVPVRLGSFADALRSQDLVPTTEVLHHGVEAPPTEVAAFLGLDTGEEALLVRRLRLGDAVPLAVEVAWFPVALVADPGEHVLEGSLYDHLDGLGVLPDAGEETVTASLPDVEEARLLAMSQSRPVLRLLRRAFAGARPVEHAEAVFPADRYELSFPLGRA